MPEIEIADAGKHVLGRLDAGHNGTARIGVQGERK
jgi:hypothetical protein